MGTEPVAPPACCRARYKGKVLSSGKILWLTIGLGFLAIACLATPDGQPLSGMLHSKGWEAIALLAFLGVVLLKKRLS